MRAAGRQAPGAAASSSRPRFFFFFKRARACHSVCVGAYLGRGLGCASGTAWGAARARLRPATGDRRPGIPPGLDVGGGAGFVGRGGRSIEVQRRRQLMVIRAVRSNVFTHTPTHPLAPRACLPTHYQYTGTGTWLRPRQGHPPRPGPWHPPRHDERLARSIRPFLGRGREDLR